MDKGLYGGLFAFLGTFCGGVFARSGWVPALILMVLGATLIVFVDNLIFNRKIDRMMEKALRWREMSDE